MASVMEGRNVLVTGARNRWSIAWNAAVSLHREGARLAFSVYGEREETSVAKLLADAGITAPIIRCDAGDETQVQELICQLSKVFDGKLHGMLHSMAMANKDELGGEYVATSRDGFILAQDVSVYTLVTLTRACRPLLKPVGGSVVTLTYLGSERVAPNYNVMGVAKAALEASVRYLASDLGPEGIRVNAVSAGPIKTLAASAISDFDNMIKHVASRAPLQRAVTAEEVGDAVMFLMSPWASAITGEVLHVDGGYNVMAS